MALKIHTIFRAVGWYCKLQQRTMSIYNRGKVVHTYIVERGWSGTNHFDSIAVHLNFHYRP
jgi:hypothetical protein